MVHIRFHETLPLRASEWVLAFIMFTWGMIVVTHPTMFATAPAFAGMEGIADQIMWGVSAIVLGVTGVVALGINGFWKATPFIRAFCAFTRCFFWLQITFGLIRSENPIDDLAIYPWLLVLDLWNIYRAMSDARIAV